MWGWCSQGILGRSKDDVILVVKRSVRAFLDYRTNRPGDFRPRSLCLRRSGSFIGFGAELLSRSKISSSEGCSECR